MTRVLITGASGFVGSHLVELLSQNKDYELFGTVFGGNVSDKALFEAHSLDLTNKQAVYDLVSAIQPDWVFHLAALSSPAASFNDENETLMNNVTAQANLLDALVEFAPKSRVLIVGSAEEYGKVSEECLPVNERCPLRPMSPYAVSKVTQDFMGVQYYLSHGLECIRVRPFNHVGERQSPQFVLPAFAQQVALIEAGKQEPVMTVGNLEASRDFTDVKDVVRAYELALLKGIPGEVYNLGSGQEVVIDDLLHDLLSLSQTTIEVKQDSQRMQKSDVPRMRADYSLFSELTGWKPQIPFNETLQRVLDYWRQQSAT